MSEAELAPAGIEQATEHQPRARAALEAALTSGPAHAYLFLGPPGSGKREAARTFAAEILARTAPDPHEARRRALIHPSPHPDLVWVEPPGAWHLVDEIRERVIRAASLRPAEGESRVFVIEAAEAMRDESQNALLKTLEEPAPFAHLILTCSQPELLLPTITSRCQPVAFSPLPPEAVLKSLGASGPEAEAVARLCGGNLDLARLLLTDQGREIRTSAERAARAVRGRFDAGDAGAPEPASPWRALLDGAERVGSVAGREAEERIGEAEAATRRSRSGKLSREGVEQVRRTARRRRTEVLDMGLALCSAWYRDLVAVSEGSSSAVLNADRGAELAADAEGLRPESAREAVELVLDTRRRLRLNVSEELALDALWLRLGEALRR